MLFNIYLTTVLANLGIYIANFGTVLVKTKIYGYKWRNLGQVNQLALSICIAVVLVALDSAIPILNVFGAIKKLCNFNKIVNNAIFELKNKGLIYDNYSIFDDEKEEKNNERFVIDRLVTKASRTGDIVGKEMVESMYLEGASESKIKEELKISKKERLDIIKKGKNEDIQKFSNSMLAETELNCELSLKEKEKLLILYKKALLSKRLNIKPIEMAEEISTKNYIKTRKENK